LKYFTSRIVSAHFIMSVVLVFDCETTGLLPKKKGDTFPSIIQLSFVLYDTVEKDMLEIYDEYVRLPPEVVLPPIVTEITGITRETLDKEGLDIRVVLEAFYKAVLKANRIVAHNMEFDFTVLLATAANMFTPLEQELCKHSNRLLCTMKTGTDLCKIERVNSRGPYYKYPTLAELHTHLFGYVPQNLHDARIDVLCCLRCFLKMSNVYDVPEPVFLEWISPAPIMCFWC
jgi:DNA polymerase III epsilon subunit-like protein